MDVINKKMQKKVLKMMENPGTIKMDRNYTARQKLSAKYASKKQNEEHRNDDQQKQNEHEHLVCSSDNSLWSDPDIQKTIECLSPEVRYKYSLIGEELFKTGGFIDKVSGIGTGTCSKKDPTISLFDLTAQIQTMIRDGLAIEDLSEDEKRVLISVLGPDEAESMYGLKLPDNDDVLKVS